MIVFVEGLSKIGKTTFIDLFMKRYPETIRFKGSGQVHIGMDDRWEEYNWYMHNIIERLDSLNNHEKIILWDRGLSEAVYSDPKWARLSKNHAHKMVVYFKLPKYDVLRKRGTKEGYNATKHLNSYDAMLTQFDTVTVEMQKRDKYMITKEMIMKVFGEITCRMPQVTLDT